MLKFNNLEIFSIYWGMILLIFPPNIMYLTIGSLNLYLITKIYRLLNKYPETNHFRNFVILIGLGFILPVFSIDKFLTKSYNFDFIDEIDQNPDHYRPIAIIGYIFILIASYLIL